MPRGVVGGAEVSQATTGAANIYMGVFRVPAGAQSMPHYHADCESAVYMLSGRLNVRWGEGLEHALSLEPGDMVYVPPRETHLLENPSEERGRGVRRRPRRPGGGLRRGALGADGSSGQRVSGPARAARRRRRRDAAPRRPVSAASSTSTSQSSHGT